jgi:hypothetical protein
MNAHLLTFTDSLFHSLYFLCLLHEKLPMLEPWRNPVYVTRAWCLYELYTALTEGKRIEIEVILTDEEDQSFLDAMTAEG